jgi:hypothetical protein
MADWGGSKTKGRSACNTSDLLGDEQACFDIDDSLKESWEVKGQGKSRAEKKKAAKARKKVVEAEAARVKAVADLEAKALKDQLAKEKAEAEKLKKLQAALATADDWDAVEVDALDAPAADAPAAVAAAPAVAAAEPEEELDDYQMSLLELKLSDASSRMRYAQAISAGLASKQLVKFMDEIFKKSSNALALDDVRSLVSMLEGKHKAAMEKEATAQSFGDYDGAADDDDGDFM